MYYNEGVYEKELHVERTNRHLKLELRQTVIQDNPTRTRAKSLISSKRFPLATFYF